MTDQEKSDAYLLINEMRRDQIDARAESPSQPGRRPRHRVRVRRDAFDLLCAWINDQPDGYFMEDAISRPVTFRGLPVVVSSSLVPRFQFEFND